MEPVPHQHKQADNRGLVEGFLANRDEQAFRRLYRQCTPYLFQLVYRLVGYRQADAEDVVQETWIRAVERLDNFRWESSFTTWLSGIAVNRCREFFRLRARANNEADIDWETVESPALGTVTPEKIDLEDAIAKLPDGYRAILVLHDVEGYTHEEIGTLLGIETGTSKSQLSRARRAVRRLLSYDKQKDQTL
jgi:RNA polymerase sigma-70 factor (ECF subfamily)